MQELIRIHSPTLSDPLGTQPEWFQPNSDNRSHTLSQKFHFRSISGSRALQQPLALCSFQFQLLRSFPFASGPGIRYPIRSQLPSGAIVPPNCLVHAKTHLSVKTLLFFLLPLFCLSDCFHPSLLTYCIRKDSVRSPFSYKTCTEYIEYHLGQNKQVFRLPSGLGQGFQ